MDSVTIRVINKYHGKIGVSYQSVMRPSPLGNPYKVKPSGPYNRSEAVDLYKTWLEGQIATGNAPVIAELDRLVNIAMDTGELNLVCCCKPLACHADIIREVLLTAIEAHQAELLKAFLGSTPITQAA